MGAALGLAIHATRKARLSRLIAVTSAARDSNPIDNALAGGVTVTTSATLPAGLTNNVSTVSGSAVNGSGTNYRVFGGVPTVASGIEINANPVSIPGTGSRFGNSQRFAIRTDAPKVAFWVNAGSLYRITVDGKLVSRSAATADPTGGFTYVIVDFSGIRYTRTIMIAIQGPQGLRGIYYGPLDRIFAPAQLPRLAFFSDSFGAGTGATIADKSVAQVTADLLGCDGWAISLGGTGYMADGSTWRAISHVSDIGIAAPDVLVVALGTNDATAGMQDAATAFLQAARLQAPSTPIIVLGPWPMSKGPSAAVMTNDASIAAAVASLNDPLMDFVSVSPTIAGAWISGTGSSASPYSGTLTFTTGPSAATSATLASNFTGPTSSTYTVLFSDGTTKTGVTMTNGSTAVTWAGAVTAGTIASYWHASAGTADVYNQADGHPIDIGHEYLGRMIASAVRNSLAKMMALIS